MFVYGLFDSRKPEEIRYIGKAANPIKRMGEHLREVRGGNAQTYKARWVRKVEREGGCICVTTLASASDEREALRCEMDLIAFYRKAGFKLTNATAGGEGVRLVTDDPASEATRRKMSMSATGRKASSGARKNMSKAVARRAAKGLINTDGLKRWTAEFRKGHCLTPETIARLSRSMTGRKVGPFTDIHRARISAAMKAYRRTPEHQVKLNEVNRQRAFSEEWHAALRVGQRRRYHGSPACEASDG